MPPINLDTKELTQQFIAQIKNGKHSALLFQLERTFHALMDIDYRELSTSEYEALNLGDRLPTGKAVLRQVVTPGELTPGLSPAQRSTKLNVVLAMERTLQTYRGIDFLLQQMAGDANTASQSLLSGLYQETVHNLMDVWNPKTAEGGNEETMLEAQQQAVKNIEAQFNGKLLNFLQSRGLTEGCEDKKDYQNLLLRLRFSAGLLDSVPTSITQQGITTAAGDTTTLYDVAHPLTRKTEEQKQSLHHRHEQLAGNLTNKPTAFTAIELAFRDLALDDTRALPAQARKTDPYGLKNGYLRHIRLVKPDSTQTDRYFMRAATLVYVGKEKEVSEGLTAQAKQNLMQSEMNAQYILQTTEPKQAHPIVLTTSTGVLDINHESTMYKHTVAAAGDDHNYSSLPQNELGALQSAEYDTTKVNTTVADFLGDRDQMSHRSSASVISAAVAFTFSLVDINGKEIALIMCASGQDRSGNTDELTCEIILHEDMPELSKEQIQAIRAHAWTQAYLATAYAPGSPGQKTKSNPNQSLLPSAKVMDDELEQASFQNFSLHTETNKKAKFDATQTEVIYTDEAFRRDALATFVKTTAERLHTQALSQHLATLTNTYHANFDTIKSQRVAQLQEMLTQRASHPAAKLTLGLFSSKNEKSTWLLQQHVTKLEEVTDPTQFLKLELQLLSKLLEASASKNGGSLNDSIDFLRFNELAAMAGRNPQQRAMILQEFLTLAESSFGVQRTESSDITTSSASGRTDTSFTDSDVTSSDSETTSTRWQAELIKFIRENKDKAVRDHDGLLDVGRLLSNYGTDSQHIERYFQPALLALFEQHPAKQASPALRQRLEQHASCFALDMPPGYLDKISKELGPEGTAFFQRCETWNMSFLQAVSGHLATVLPQIKAELNASDIGDMNDHQLQAELTLAFSLAMAPTVAIAQAQENTDQLSATVAANTMLGTLAQSLVTQRGAMQQEAFALAKNFMTPLENLHDQNIVEYSTAFLNSVRNSQELIGEALFQDNGVAEIHAKIDAFVANFAQESVPQHLKNHVTQQAEQLKQQLVMLREQGLCENPTLPVNERISHLQLKQQQEQERHHSLPAQAERLVARYVLASPEAFATRRAERIAELDSMVFNRNLSITATFGLSLFTQNQTASQLLHKHAEAIKRITDPMTFLHAELKLLDSLLTASTSQKGASLESSIAFLKLGALGENTTPGEVAARTQQLRTFLSEAIPQVKARLPAPPTDTSEQTRRTLS